MTYDSLIDRLAEDLTPVRRRRLGLDMATVAIICVVELALFFALGAGRTHMPGVMQQPAFWWRLCSLGSIALISGALAILSFNPVYAPKRGVRSVALIVVACLVLGLCLGAGPASLTDIIRRVNWTDGIQCAGKVIALSIPPLVGLGVLMRRGAPTDSRNTALLVGLAAAAWGAFVFVFACPFDDPLYIAVWYSAGCGIVTGFSRFALPRLSRW